MRLLKDYLKKQAHPFYEEGLNKAGISTETIPNIEEMSRSLKKYGWKTVPVSGFLPPTVFLEMQSLGFLPIAKEIRSVDHIPYTPAPDIVHEAAGHAPFLAHPDFTNYLHKYAEIANQSIISSEDIMLYKAIRKLSDVKEHPDSSKEEIEKANQELEEAVNSISYVSEAARVSRLYWWTAEYGLVGSMNEPKLYGAGLLSSIGEAREYLSDKVKKIPLDINCINYDYDITEPQPQLFVVKDFKNLHKVLDELADTFSFRRGGEYGLKEAIQSKIVNTIVLDSGLEISGVVEKYLKNKNGRVVFVKTTGPTQLAFEKSQLEGHDKSYHSHGYSTLVDTLKDGTNLNDLSREGLASKGIIEGQNCNIEFLSGIILNGELKKILSKNNTNLLFTFDNCKITWNDEILFAPDWGTFDLGLGTSIPSVYSGPADTQAYGDVEDFSAVIIPRKPFSEEQKKVHALYQEIRDLRESFLKNQDAAHLEKTIENLYKKIKESFSKEWLSKMEIYELSFQSQKLSNLQKQLEKELKEAADTNKNLESHIHDGLRLASVINV